MELGRLPLSKFYFQAHAKRYLKIKARFPRNEELREGHGGQAAAYKWKISREHQPTAIKELTALSAALSAGAGGKAALLDPEIREMVATYDADEEPRRHLNGVVMNLYVSAF